jgi:hypothetical protein
LGADEKDHKTDGISGGIIKDADINPEQHKNREKNQKTAKYRPSPGPFFLVQPKGKKKNAAFRRGRSYVYQKFY